MTRMLFSLLVVSLLWSGGCAAQRNSIDRGSFSSTAQERLLLDEETVHALRRAAILGLAAYAHTRLSGNTPDSELDAALNRFGMDITAGVLDGRIVVY